MRFRAAMSESGSEIATPRAEATTAICRLSVMPLSSSSQRLKSGGKSRDTNFAPCSRPVAKRAGVNSSCAAA